MEDTEKNRLSTDALGKISDNVVEKRVFSNAERFNCDGDSVQFSKEQPKTLM